MSYYSAPPSSTAHSEARESCYRPQNKYLCYLLDEFDKCTQQGSDVTILKKDVLALKKNTIDLTREVQELKYENAVVNDKLTACRREIQECRMLHRQLREDTSCEFRHTYHQLGDHQKQIETTKYRVQLSAKKRDMDLENLRWEIANSARYNSRDSCIYPSNISSQMPSDKNACRSYGL